MTKGVCPHKTCRNTCLQKSVLQAYSHAGYVNCMALKCYGLTGDSYTQWQGYS